MKILPPSPARVKGAVVGEIADDDAGKGAAAGAAAGVVAGGMKTRQQRRQQQATYDEARNTYNCALGACLKGKGYTVK